MDLSQSFRAVLIIYIFGRRVAENGKNNLKSILSPVYKTLEFLTWDKQTFQFKPIRKLLTSKYQNVLNELQCKWPKRTKEYITKLDERLNQQSTNENASISIDADSSLALRIVQNNMSYII